MPSTEIVSGVLAIIGLATAIWAVAKWLFGPRVKLAIVALLEPVNSAIADLHEANTEQHAETAEAFVDLRTFNDARWADHKTVHDGLVASLDRIEERQDDLTRGVAQLPNWAQPPPP